MADKPIIFSGPMVRALLDGRKTQTRRIVKGVPDAPAMDNIVWHENKLHPAPYLDAYCGAKRTAENPRGMTANWAYWTRDDRPGPLFKVGYAPGDRLWVREAHSLHHALGQGVEVGTEDDGRRWGPWGGLPTQISPDGRQIAYFREGFDRSGAPRWRPSIHMPRWASRLTLTVTDVRVQRLWDISEADAKDEGVAPPPEGNHPETSHYDSYGDVFADLWNSLHGPDAWVANPWVVALTFDVHRCNIARSPDS